MVAVQSLWVGLPQKKRLSRTSERRRHARCRLGLSSFELGLATSRYGRNVVRRQHHEGSSERTSALPRLGGSASGSEGASSPRRTPRSCPVRRSPRRPAAQRCAPPPARRLSARLPG